jgi:hypothetical protein
MTYSVTLKTNCYYAKRMYITNANIVFFTENRKMTYTYLWHIRQKKHNIPWFNTNALKRLMPSISHVP